MPPPTSARQDTGAFPEGSAWLRCLPFLVLLLASVAALLAWSHFPDRWAVHWGRHGKPDRWAHKTLLDVFFPLGFGVFMCGVFEGIAMWLLAYPQVGKNPRVAPAVARALARLTVEFIRIISVALALVFAGLALVLPLWHPLRSGRIVLSVLLIFGMAMAFGMWRMRQGARALQARGLFAGLDGWNGIIYSNARDPRVWVPKISGPGSTLNFAHRAAWLWLLAFLAVPLCVIVIVLVVAWHSM